MSNPQQKDPCKVITGRVRASYAKVYKAESMEEGQEPKFSCSFLIDKSDKATLKKIEDAIAAAKEAGRAKFGDKWAKSSLKQPLRDGAEKEESNKEYAGKMFLSAYARQNQKPGIILPNKQPISDESQFYSGCECLASLRFYPYNSTTAKGVAVSLDNILTYNTGESFEGGKASADNDFAEVDAEDYSDDIAF